MSKSIYDINRKYEIDNEYFYTIDTEQKAYWLGFLWADGHISKTNIRCSGNNRITLAQKEIEKNHLSLLTKELRTTTKPYKINKIINGNQQYEYYVLNINSRPLCKQLETLGFDKKDKRTHIPPIKSELLHHFIRGYFDGDGCLSIYQQHVNKWVINKQELSFTGNEIFLIALKNELMKQIPSLSDNKIKRYKRTSNAITIRWGKKNDVLKICEYIYSSATIYLPSKYHKYQIFLHR